MKTADEFGGERKIVTVLFADIVESSNFVGDADPESANDFLLSVIQLIIDEVHRFGGTVAQVLGDGILALFGAPTAQEDHSLRACLSADAMHRSVANSFPPDDAPSSASISIRVGLSSGEVVTSLIPNDFAKEFRVTGKAVYLAARMQELALPGKTLLTADTLELTSHQVIVRPGKWYSLRDGDPAVRTYQLEGFYPGGKKRARLPQEVRSLFVGREEELEVLNTGLRKAAEGQSAVVVALGEPGVGKTRLLAEFLGTDAVRRCHVVACDLLPLGLTQPMEPLQRTVRMLLGLAEERSDHQLREDVVKQLDMLGLGTGLRRSALLDLLGIPHGDEAWRPPDAADKLSIMVAAITELAKSISRAVPVIMVFDDYHWADSATSQFVETLVEQISGSHILLIVTTRSQRDPPWSAQPVVCLHRIRPLSVEHSREYLDELLGDHPELEELKDRLIEITGGNPFFLGECVLVLRQSEVLCGQPGAHRLATPVSDVEIPGTVQAVLAERIDALPSAQKSVLLCASVIGREIDIGLLAEVSQKSRAALQRDLELLEGAGFLRRTRIMPNVEYSFQHALIHDVAYATLLKRRRLELHVRALDAVRRRQLSGLPRKIELLAFHAFRAENWSEAYAYSRLAGRSAQKRSRNREAVQFLDWALEALSRLARSRRNQQREIDTRLLSIQALFPLGERDRVREELSKAESIAQELSDEARLGQIASERLPYHWSAGELSMAIETGKRAAEIARRQNDIRLEVQVGARLGSLYSDLGDYRLAIQYHEATIEKIHPFTTLDHFGIMVIASVGCLTTWARSLGELGEFDEALRVGDEGIRIAEESRNLFSQIYGYLYAMNPLLRKGDFSRTLPFLRRAVELCEMTRSRLLHPLAAASLGYAHVHLGDTGEGLALLEESTREADRRALRFQLAQQLTWLSEAYVAAERLDDAERTALRALELARHQGERGDEAWANWLLGEILLKRSGSDIAEAEACLRRAAGTAEERGMRPLSAHCLAGHSRLMQCRSKLERAAFLGEKARTRFAALGMTYWLRKLEREMEAWPETTRV